MNKKSLKHYQSPEGGIFAKQNSQGFLTGPCKLWKVTYLKKKFLRNLENYEFYLPWVFTKVKSLVCKERTAESLSYNSFKRNMP